MKGIVTGGRGFLGWHMRCCLSSEEHIETTAVGRDLTSKSSGFSELLKDADFVVHLAGVNRGSDKDVLDGNRSAATELVEALERCGSTPLVVYASSTHIDLDTNYGQAKRAAGEHIKSWADRSGAKYINLVLPHVFGELARPNYNSVTATFCHQLVHDQQPVVTHDSELNLIHAQDVADIVMELVCSNSSGDYRPEGRQLRVSELRDLLVAFDHGYRVDGIIPEFANNTERDLFNSYRSYLYPDFYPMMLQRREDNRGYLFEVIKSGSGGQVFFSSTKPGITRGNHFHRRKIERFAVIKGAAEIAIRRLFDDKVITYKVGGDKPSIVDIPTLHTHNITNIGDSELLTLFWANEIFDQQRPDTESLRVLQ